jgi:hypothetical protein
VAKKAAKKAALANLNELVCWLWVQLVTVGLPRLTVSLASLPARPACPCTAPYGER